MNKFNLDKYLIKRYSPLKLERIKKAYFNYDDVVEILNEAEKIDNQQGNEVLADVIRCPKCGGENEYSQGFKQNIQPVDGGDWRQVCFNICDRCGYAIDVWFWD
jgi:predicted Zn-ribbon and HTH transcriptional regulator